MVLPGKPARPCPLPLLPSAVAPGLACRPPERGQRTRGLSWRRGRALALDLDVLEASPEPRARCRRALVPPPSPRHWGSAHCGIAPFPGRARTCHGRLLASGALARRGHEAVRALGFCPGKEQGRVRCTDFSLRLARVRAPNPPSRPRVLWLGPEGTVGREGRGYRGDGVGVQVAGVGAAQRSSTSPQMFGGTSPPSPELQTTRTAGAGGMTATRLPASGSAHVRAKVRGGGGEGLSPRPSGSSGGCG